MLEPGGEADLALEALGAERGGELGMQDLEGDRPVVAEVVGEVDRGHAAAAELALDRVAAGESCLQRCASVGQGWSLVVGIAGKVSLDGARGKPNSAADRLSAVPWTMADRAHRRLTLMLLVLAGGCIHPAGSPAYRSAVERGYTVSYDSTRRLTTVEGLGLQASRRLLVTALFETAGESLQRPDTVYPKFAAEAGDWGFLHFRDVTLLLDDSVHLALGAARPEGPGSPWPCRWRDSAPSPSPARRRAGSAKPASS